MIKKPAIKVTSSKGSPVGPKKHRKINPLFVLRKAKGIRAGLDKRTLEQVEAVLRDPSAPVKKRKTNLAVLLHFRSGQLRKKGK